MSRWLSRLGTQRLKIVVTAVVMLAAAGSALAFFSSTGSGTAAASVGALGTPSRLTGTPGTGTVALSWTGISAPGSGAVSYYVTRNGGTPGGNCPTSAAPSAVTSCTDSSLDAGTYQYTVTAVWNSWTSTTSATSVTVATGALNHFLVSAPTSATAGSPFNVTLTAQDDRGNTVTSYTGTQTLTFSGADNSPSGAAPTFPATVTFTNGVGTASVDLVDAETAKVKVAQSGIQGQSGVIVVGPATATGLSLSAPGSQTAGAAFNETITALDTYGNTATGYTGSQAITFTGPANSPNSTAPSYPAGVTFTSGIGTASVTLYDAQASTALTATQGSLTGSSASFTVNPAAAASFSLSSPGTQTAGTAFNETITAVDGYGNTATSYTGSNAITFTGPASAPGGTIPSYPASVSFSGGVGTASITLYDAQTAVLTATQGSLTGNSASFTVNPASAAAFSLSTPATQTAGTAFNDTITAIDGYGNTATGYTGSKTITFTGPANSPGGTAPSYLASVTFTAGAGTASITLYDAQTTALTATQSSTTGTSAAFNVTAGSASSFSLPAPATQTAGTAFNETITAHDAYGNTATGYTGSQTITFTGPANSPGGTAPSYPASVTFTSGAGTTAITLYDAQTTALTATQSSTTGTSASFSVNPLGAASFRLSTPTTQTAGAAFNDTITAIDGYGNTATSYTGSNAITFTGPANSPGGTIPSYPASVTFTAGTGTAAITLYDAQTTAVTATQGSLTGNSASFTVGPAGAAAFSLSTPTTQTAGTAFNDTITAIDGYGNTATSYTGSKTVTFTGPANSPGGTAPSYPANVSFTSGVGTASITLYDAQTPVLTATQGSVTGSSASFTVNSATSAAFKLSAPGTQTAGTGFNETITARDSYGNAVTGYTGSQAITFTGAANSPGGTIPSYPASVTFTSGVGTASITLYDAQTAVLTATQGSLTGNSASFTVNPASAAAFSLSTPAAQTAGTAFNDTVTAIDGYGNTATGYTGSQTITFTGPANSPNATAPSYPASVTFTAGTGTASITLYDAQTPVLTATQGSLAGSSASFTVNPLAAAKFSLSAPGAQTAGTAFNETITALDTYGNTATSYAGSKTITFTGPANSPNSTAPSYPASVTFTSGAGTAAITLTDAQTTTLTATQSTITGTSASFAVSAGAAATFTLPTPATQTAGTAFNETITAHDAYGNTATGYTGSQTITFTGPSNSPNATAPSYPANVTFTAGAGTASITLYDAQTTTTLTATQSSVTGTSGGFAVNGGASHTIAASATSPQTAGTAFNVTLTAQDTWGNPTGSLSGTKNVSFSGPGSSPNSNAPSYPASVTFSAGVATASVTLYDAQTTAITAVDTTDGYGGVASSNIVVNPASAASFNVPVPSGATAGTQFNETITALDTYGNTATSYAGSKTITFTGPANSPNSTAPSYPASVTFTSGAGTAAITLTDAQTTTLTATQSTITGTSASFAVSAGAAATFTLPTPATQTAGTAFNETITAHDAYGNTATGYTGSQTITFTGPSNSPNATAPSYPANVTFTAGAGTASITLTDVQASTTLTATQGTVSGTSGSFAVIAGGAASFSLPTPGTQTAATAFNETITAHDAYGNTATSYAGAKTITFTGPANSPGGTAPTYPGSVTFTSGAGTASITLADAQTTTLTATQGTLTGTSGGFTVNVGAANKLAITSAALTGPASTTATMGPITVQMQDAGGNAVNAGTGGESVTLSSNTTGTGVFSATFGGTSTTTVTIPNGSSSTTFYYGDTAAGTPTITVAHAAAPALTSGTQQETVAAPVGLGIVVTGGTGTPVAACGAPSANYTCAISGVGIAGSATFYVTFVNAAGVQTVYSATLGSTVTETGQNTGTVSIAAGASSSSPNMLTAAHPGNSMKTSTLTFGSFTLTVTVSS